MTHCSPDQRRQPHLSTRWGLLVRRPHFGADQYNESLEVTVQSSPTCRDRVILIGV
jgi:hypothetical protein